MSKNLSSKDIVLGRLEGKLTEKLCKSFSRTDVYNQVAEVLLEYKFYKESEEWYLEALNLDLNNDILRRLTGPPAETRIKDEKTPGLIKIPAEDLAEVKRASDKLLAIARGLRNGELSPDDVTIKKLDLAAHHLSVGYEEQVIEKFASPNIKEVEGLDEDNPDRNLKQELEMSGKPELTEEEIQTKLKELAILITYDTDEHEAIRLMDHIDPNTNQFGFKLGLLRDLAFQYAGLGYENHIASKFGGDIEDSSPYIKRR